jgi:hypothetical protein
VIEPFKGIEDARALAQAIVDTVREPLLVLDGDLRVLAVSRSYYLTSRLPEAPLPSDKRPGKVSSTALVRFRINDYSAPTAYGFRDVVAKGFVDEVAHEVHSLGRLFGPNMRWVS